MIRTINLVFERYDDEVLKAHFDQRAALNVSVVGCEAWDGMIVTSRRETFDPRTNETIFVYDLAVL